MTATFELAKMSFDQYEVKRGYDPWFLGVPVPLPQVAATPEDDLVTLLDRPLAALAGLLDRCDFHWPPSFVCSIVLPSCSLPETAPCGCFQRLGLPYALC